VHSQNHTPLQSAEEGIAGSNGSSFFIFAASGDSGSVSMGLL
jgi:hypothetical protein